MAVHVPVIIGPLQDSVSSELIALGRKLHSGTFKTKELVPLQPDFALL